MTWFKVDDGFGSSRKVLSIPRTHRLAAVGAWTLAGSWSARELSNGVVPGYVLDELGVTPRLRQALVTARLWLDQPDGGIEFANWSEYQPTREHVEKNRENEREKKRRAREKRAGIPVGVPGGQAGESPGESVLPDPTRPDPTTSSTEEVALLSDADGADESNDPKWTFEIRELADRIAGMVRANGYTVKTVGVGWWRPIEQMIRIDGRTLEQIEIMARWATSDSFWSMNIRSARTLREQFEQLRSRRNASLKDRGSVHAGESPTDRALATLALAEQPLRAVGS